MKFIIDSAVCVENCDGYEKRGGNEESSEDDKAAVKPFALLITGYVENIKRNGLFFCGRSTK